MPEFRSFIFFVSYCFDQMIHQQQKDYCISAGIHFLKYFQINDINEEVIILVVRPSLGALCINGLNQLLFVEQLTPPLPIIHDT